MKTIKIQINHKKPITLNKLANILYDEIGKEYDFNHLNLIIEIFWNNDYE
jgi:hypothetical protein